MADAKPKAENGALGRENNITADPTQGGQRSTGGLKGEKSVKKPISPSPRQETVAVTATANTAAPKTQDVKKVANASAIKAPKAKKVVQKAVSKKQAAKKKKAAVSTEKPTQKKGDSKMATEKKEKFIDETVADIKELQDVVQSAIEQNSKSLEQVHRSIARLPLKYLGKIKKIEEEAKDVEDIQEKIIDHTYDLIRSVNTQLFDVSKEIVGLVSTR